MQSTHSGLEALLAIARLNAILSRKSFLSLGFSDFVILHHLYHAPEEKMRRVDLADCVGLTASGVTRVLLPMEKIGLIEREANPRDARVSFVCLAKGGKRLYQESLESVELVLEKMTEDISKKDLSIVQTFLQKAVKSL